MNNKPEYTALVKGFCEAEGMSPKAMVTIDALSEIVSFEDIFSRFLSYAIEQGVMCDYKQSQKTLLKTIELHELEIEGLKNRIAEQLKTDKLTLQECKDIIAQRYDFDTWAEMDKVMDLKDNLFHEVNDYDKWHELLDEAAEMYADQFKANQLIAEPETKICSKCKCSTAATNFEKGDDRCILCDIDFEPCGGCGNDDPMKRCIGCMHPFNVKTAPGEANTAKQVTDEDVKTALSEILNSMDVSSHFDTKENCFGGGFWAAYRWMRDKLTTK